MGKTLRLVVVNTCGGLYVVGASCLEDVLAIEYGRVGPVDEPKARLTSSDKELVMWEGVQNSGENTRGACDDRTDLIQRGGGGQIIPPARAWLYETEGSKSYTILTSHGTTVLWYRESPTQIYVAVDSRETMKMIANDPLLLRQQVEILNSDSENKLVIIQNYGQDVYATLIGDSRRCKGMVAYVHQHLKVRGVKCPLFFIGGLATTYFQNIDTRNPNSNDFPCKVYLCSWVAANRRYLVLEVGDMLIAPNIIYDVAWGGGGWSDIGVTNLSMIRTPFKVSDLVGEMLKASTADPNTGGPIYVYSLGIGGRFRFVCTTSLVEMLSQCDEKYEDILYSNSMLVIISEKDGEIVDPNDLNLHIQRYGPEVNRDKILWLCLLSGFLVILVQLESEVVRDRWFDSCTEVAVGALVRSQEFENMDRGECTLYVAKAGQEIVNRIKTMRTIWDLTN